MFKLQYFTSQLIEVESTWRACVRDKTKTNVTCVTTVESDDSQKANPVALFKRIHTWSSRLVGNQIPCAWLSSPFLDS